MHTIFDGTIRAFRVRCSLARSGFSVNSAVQRGEPLWESAAATSAAFLSGYNIYTYMANLSTSDGIRCRIVCASECECVHVWVCVCVFVNTHNFAVKRSKLWVRVCASVHKFCVLLSNYVIECTVCCFYEHIGESRQTTRGEWQHKQHRSSPPQPCSGIPLICDDEPMFTDFVIVSLSNLIGFVSPFVCGGCVLDFSLMNDCTQCFWYECFLFFSLRVLFISTTNQNENNIELLGLQTKTVVSQFQPTQQHHTV